jgi:hypothetical protein
VEYSIVQTLALTLGAGWASGINLYATILTLGVANALGYTTLPPQLQLLSDPLVLAGAGFMYFIEFFADKTPGVDTGWDALHTFIRIPAGALLAAGAAGGFHVNEAAQFAAALVGGGLAAGSHITKAGTRVLINTSPEPFSNWAASFAEDFAVIGGLWTALGHPWVFLTLLVLFILLVAWLLPRLWRAVRLLATKIAGFFRGADAEKESPGADTADTAPPRGRTEVLRNLYNDARNRPR